MNQAPRKGGNFFEPKFLTITVTITIETLPCTQRDAIANERDVEGSE